MDYTNRVNLHLKKPVYGEDCRRAIKVSLLFGDVFDAKRHKNLDRYNPTQSDLFQAPQSVLNSFALSLTPAINRDVNNSITDFPDQSPQTIEDLFAQPLLVKEIPLSL